MAKGYWIVRADVTDPEGFKAYLEAVPAVFRKHGAKFLARGGTFESPEGKTRTRNTILEFPSYAAALDCYGSAEYRAAMALRKPHSEVEIVIVQGYEGPQP